MKVMVNDDLFEIETPAAFSTDSSESHLPLAAKMRPARLGEVVGQDHLIGPGKLLHRIITTDKPRSLILYGPPGSGKTTFARIISKETKSIFVSINAVTSNVAEVRKKIQQAETILKQKGSKTILFIDEIHRFSKSQQDVLMPFVENGIIILIGATTQNPSFALNAPLL